jgi:thiol-disulfide isomerase/thioredoxin
MSRRTAVVYFFMIGCPHCEAMKPAWMDAKKNLKNVEIREKEARDVGPEDGVQSFPTIVVLKKGKEVKRLEGKRSTGGEIIKELGLQKGGGLGRSGRERRTHRRQRKLARRTLRNYKSFA